MYDAYSLVLIYAFINVPQSLTLMRVCMMYISMIPDLDPVSMILDPDTCDHDAHEFIHDPDTYVYDAFINVPRSLTLMHVCMMHISMILDA